MDNEFIVTQKKQVCRLISFLFLIFSILGILELSAGAPLLFSFADMAMQKKNRKEKPRGKLSINLFIMLAAKKPTKEHPLWGTCLVNRANFSAIQIKEQTMKDRFLCVLLQFQGRLKPASHHVSFRLISQGRG